MKGLIRENMVEYLENYLETRKFIPVKIFRVRYKNFILALVHTPFLHAQICMIG